jgi:hypothetical protein
LLFSFGETEAAYQYHAICADRWGDVYLALRNKEQTRYYVQKYNNHGIRIVGWEMPKGEGCHMDSLAVDSEGNLYAADAGEVDVFTPASPREMAGWLSIELAPHSTKVAAAP